MKKPRGGCGVYGAAAICLLCYFCHRCFHEAARAGFMHSNIPVCDGARRGCAQPHQGCSSISTSLRLHLSVDHSLLTTAPHTVKLHTLDETAAVQLQAHRTVSAARFTTSSLWMLDRLGTVMGSGVGAFNVQQRQKDKVASG